MKLLASDYDGTIKFGDVIMEEDLDAIQRWKDEGNLFALVTGRSRHSIKREIEKCPMPVDYLVANNGALIYGPDGSLLNISTLDTITALDLMFAAHEQSDVVSYVVVDENNRYKVDVHPHLEDHHYALLEPTLEEAELMDKGNFIQLVYSMRNQEAAVQMADSINHYFGEQVHAYANDFVVYIVPANVNKGTGLQFVSAYSDVDDDDVCAIGDNYNDLPMLTQAARSASLATSPSEVLSNVNEVHPSIASFIETILEEG